jgi:hypothetical protein
MSFRDIRQKVFGRTPVPRDELGIDQLSQENKHFVLNFYDAKKFPRSMAKVLVSLKEHLPPLFEDLMRV